MIKSSRSFPPCPFQHWSRFWSSSHHTPVRPNELNNKQLNYKVLWLRHISLYWINTSPQCRPEANLTDTLECLACTQYAEFLTDVVKGYWEAFLRSSGTDFRVLLIDRFLIFKSTSNLAEFLFGSSHFHVSISYFIYRNRWLYLKSLQMTTWQL